MGLGAVDEPHDSPSIRRSINTTAFNMAVKWFDAVPLSKRKKKRLETPMPHRPLDCFLGPCAHATFESRWLKGRCQLRFEQSAVVESHKI